MRLAVPLARGMQLLVFKFSFIIQRGLLAFEPQKEMNPEQFHIAIFFFLSVSSQVLVNLQKQRIIMKMYQVIDSSLNAPPPSDNISIDLRSENKEINLVLLNKK